MQQAYKFTRIIPNNSDRTERYIAVQYLRAPRVIIYDTLHMRVRRPHAAEGAGGDYDIWNLVAADVSSDIHSFNHTLQPISERRFVELVDSSYPKVMARMHSSGDTPLSVDKRWEAAFQNRYRTLTGTRSAASNVCRISGHEYSSSGYIRIKKYRKALAAAVAARDDTEVFDNLDSLYDAYNQRAYIVERAIDGINGMGWMNDNICIAECGHLSWEGDTHTVNGDLWCDSCFEENAVHVENRDEYMARDDVYEHSDGLYYTYEEEHNDDDDDDNNDDDDEPRRLMGYSTNVLRHLVKDDNIKSSPFGDFLMGVELEMCAGSRRTVDDAVSDVLSQLGDGYCVCKSDGSLPDDGLEIVTAPRGLAEHIDRFKNWNINPSYRAWNSGKCGVHVHIDARAFSQLTLGKFVIFINAEDNKDFIRKIAGRHPAIDNQAQRYCAMEGQEQLANPKQALKGKDSNRYYMVNLSNLTSAGAAKLGLPDWKFSGRYNTVELRIFRASLKKERLLAQLEFTHAAVMFVRAASYRDLTGAAFVAWLKKYGVLYPHLAAWYGVAPIKKANPNAAPAVVSSDETVST
jgi:hypothetical protein